MKSKNYTLTTMPYSLTIGWLYPELMSTYGDRGNIIVLEKRCEWRGISAQVVNLDKGFNVKLFNDVDILFMGGAQDLQQKIVSDDFSKEKKGKHSLYKIYLLLSLFWVLNIIDILITLKNAGWDVENSFKAFERP